jgi:hypothetical protein
VCPKSLDWRSSKASASVTSVLQPLEQAASSLQYCQALLFQLCFLATCDVDADGTGTFYIIMK